ncbi:MAG: DUF6776 family protein, partial [Lysobacteraceae bacterium]
MDMFTLVRHLRLPPLRRGARWTLIAIALLWLASLVLAWWWAQHSVSEQLSRMHAVTTQAQAQAAQISGLQQQVTKSKRSDDISRAANQELQTSLSERDEEVSALRADVAFYERLVGTSGQRRGLSVHSVKMQQDSNGSWHYDATLIQNLNRGKVSQGDLTLQIEGATAGKLQTLMWNDLLQKPNAPPQPFNFRYFQQVEGTVMMPPGFTPHRV